MYDLVSSFKFSVPFLFLYIFIAPKRTKYDFPHFSPFQPGRFNGTRQKNTPVYPVMTPFPMGPFASFNNKRSSKASRPGNVSQAYPKVGFFTSLTLSFRSGREYFTIQ